MLNFSVRLADFIQASCETRLIVEFITATIFAMEKASITYVFNIKITIYVYFMTLTTLKVVFQGNAMFTNFELKWELREMNADFLIKKYIVQIAATYQTQPVLQAGLKSYKYL